MPFGLSNTQLNDVIPQAELAVIPNAGYEMFFENPEESVVVVRAYLNAPAR